MKNGEPAVIGDQPGSHCEAAPRNSCVSTVIFFLFSFKIFFFDLDHFFLSLH